MVAGGTEVWIEEAKKCVARTVMEEMAGTAETVEMTEEEEEAVMAVTMGETVVGQPELSQAWAAVEATAIAVAAAALAGVRITNFFRCRRFYCTN